MGKRLDLTNKKFGRLTALYPAPSKNRHTYWHCKCECGKECDVRTDSLTSEAIKSCGCYKKEKDILKVKEAGKRNCKNLIGETFGYLNPYEQTNKRENGHVIWKCYCNNCGRTCEVSSLYLLRGNTISCGCISRSNGEEKIYNLLKEKNIVFEEQKQFNTCIFPDTDRPARFDFFIDNRYLLEFHGIQHYDKNNPWYREGKDEYKQLWAEQNNIPLVIIKYDRLESLTFENIWLEGERYEWNECCYY